MRTAAPALQAKEKCVYCGTNDATTDDHAVPKNLFPGQVPHSEIKVPSCADCNGSFAKHEEYFRTILFVALAETNAEIAKLYPKFKRSLTRKGAEKFLALMVNSIKRVDRQTQGGIYLPDRTPAIEYVEERVNIVLRKVIRGMFYKWKGYPLPKDYIVDAIMHADSHPLPKKALLVPGSGEYRKVGDGKVFAYWVKPTVDNPECIAWLLSFYDTLPALGATRPPHIGEPNPGG